MVVSGRELVLREEEGGYRLALTLGGRREVYHLRRKQENVEVLVVAEEGEVLSPSPTAPVELFVDVQRGASLLISWGNSTGVKEQGEEGGVEVRGVVGGGRTIHPVPHLGQGAHLVTTGDHPPPGSDYQEVEEGVSGRQGRATMPSTIHPEILVVADHAFYQSMDKDINTIQAYLTTYFNAVNMRFAKVRLPCSTSSPTPPQMTRPKVMLSIAGIMVASSTKSLPYITSHTSKGDMLDAPSCLHSMGQYYYKTR